MKTIRTKFFRGYNAILAGLLSVLGFASCQTDAPVEYGTPNAKFIVNGKVTSVETQQPIKDIQVTMQGDTTTTDENGNFQVMDGSGFPTDQTYSIRFQDIDGESNGNFQDLDTIVEFVNPEFEGGNGHWYEGETSTDFDVELNPEE